MHSSEYRQELIDHYTRATWKAAADNGWSERQRAQALAKGPKVVDAMLKNLRGNRIERRKAA